MLLSNHKHGNVEFFGVILTDDLNVWWSLFFHATKLQSLWKWWNLCRVVDIIWTLVRTAHTIREHTFNTFEMIVVERRRQRRRTKLLQTKPIFQSDFTPNKKVLVFCVCFCFFSLSFFFQKWNNNKRHIYTKSSLTFSFAILFNHCLLTVPSCDIKKHASTWRRQKPNQCSERNPFERHILTYFSLNCGTK